MMGISDPLELASGLRQERALDVHENEIGTLGFEDAFLSVRGFDNPISRASEEVAQDTTQVLLSSTIRMRFVMPRPPGSRLGSAAPSERLRLCRASTRPRCARRASPRSAWRWRAQGPCRLSL